MIDKREYIRIEDIQPIWFLWSSIKDAYETVYSYDFLERVYQKNKK